MLLYPEDVDRRLNWPLGRAARMAKRKALPHIILPDGSTRFIWHEIEPLLRQIPLEKPTVQMRETGAVMLDKMLTDGLLMPGDDPRLAKKSRERRGRKGGRP